MKTKALKLCVSVLLSLNMIACTQPQSETTLIPASERLLPSLQVAITCLPQGAALIAAHRGTSKGTDYPENSLSGLNTLINKGYFITEVDVSSTKDGTHFLFHDGVLDEKTVSRGVIAAKNWDEIKTTLLRDTRGKISTDTLPILTDYLNRARHKIYIEIDFKSTADYAKTIQTIRKTDMQDYVILIAYTQAQARRLNQLAPEMIISISENDYPALRNTTQSSAPVIKWALWRGNNSLDPSPYSLHTNKVVNIGFDKNQNNKTAAKHTQILVSDYALSSDPIITQKSSDKDDFFACLKQQK